MSMNEIAVMNADGDARTFWDSANPEEVAVAKALFERLRGKGHMIYRAGENKSVQVHEFDPEAGKLVAVAPLVGG
jgi:hypothetical protein